MLLYFLDFWFRYELLIKNLVFNVQAFLPNDKVFIDIH